MGSCFGKPKGAELDGEYKASTDVKAATPDIDLVSVDTPDIDAGLSMPKYGVGGSLSDIGAFGVDVDTDVKIEAPKADINVELPKDDAVVEVKSPELDVTPIKATAKPKSSGLSCFGKPKGKELDGEYKASADVKVDTPEGDISADIPSVDASVAVKYPELDVKPVKVAGKPKSSGLSCFGKPKGKDLDGEYKASADVKVDAPEGDISADIPSVDASVAVKSPELDVK